MHKSIQRGEGSKIQIEFACFLNGLQLLGLMKLVVNDSFNVIYSSMDCSWVDEI